MTITATNQNNLNHETPRVIKFKAAPPSLNVAITKQIFTKTTMTQLIITINDRKNKLCASEDLKMETQDRREHTSCSLGQDTEVVFNLKDS